MTAVPRPEPPPGAVFYHGGPPGLASVEPRRETDARATADLGGCLRFLAPSWRVYVTTELRMARYYAAAWAFVEAAPAGHVYVVRPRGDVDLDVVTPGSWSCDSAEVVSVHSAVTESRLPELAAWRQWWIPRQPRLAPGPELRAFYVRAGQRAVQHGHDRATVLEALNAAAARAPGGG